MTVVDDAGFLARSCETSTSPMLARADPYRDLTLTPSEMDQLVDELGRLSASTAQERAFLRDITDLALRCRADLRTELHLQGD